jgi:tetratricopeptide (TPR) repeat protein
VELGSQYHPVRELVRGYAKTVDAELIARLKAFYANRKGAQEDGEQLAKCISLAVNITDAPGFKPILREEALPPDARSVIGFLDLMREFYQKARIAQHWVEVRPEYEKAMVRVAPPVRDAIVRTDAYMRVPLGESHSRTITIYLELAAPQNSVNVRSNQDSYFVVLGDSASPKVDDLRHAYLHFQLDNLVLANVRRIQNSSQLLNLVKKAEGVDASYTSEFHIMAAESLIRAVELRTDRAPAVRARESIDAYYRSGLLLAPYFYAALEEYEQGDVGLRDAFVDMARNIDVKKEQARFQETFFKIPVPKKEPARAEVPAAPPEPEPDPVTEALKAAQAAFNSGDTARAQTAFEKVLSDLDKENGGALYGLGLIAGKKGESDEARQYFERAVRSDSAEPGMRIWSYVYLGRMFDLECERERAVEYYQQAVKVQVPAKVDGQAEEDIRNGQAAAKAGVQKAFGDGCR